MLFARWDSRLVPNVEGRDVSSVVAMGRDAADSAAPVIGDGHPIRASDTVKSPSVGVPNGSDAGQHTSVVIDRPADSGVLKKRLRTGSKKGQVNAQPVQEATAAVKVVDVPAVVPSTEELKRKGLEKKAVRRSIMYFDG